MHANFGDCSLRDTDLRTLKLKKNGDFVPKICYFTYNKKMAERTVERCNLDTTWVEKVGVCVPSWRAPTHGIKISEAEN